MTILEPDIAPQEPVLNLEMGVELQLPFSVQYEDKAEIWNEEVITIQQLKDMRRQDGQARALLRILSLPIRGAAKHAKVCPAEEGSGDEDPKGQEEADFIQQMFTLPPHRGGMSVPIDRLMSQICLAFCDGFAAFEIVYTFAEAPSPLAGKIVIRKLARRPATTCTFLADSHGGFAGVRQKTNYQGKEVDVIFEPPYVWYYAANEEENKFYGQSHFLSAYYHFDRKMKLYFIAHLAAQFRAVPGRIGTHPINPDAKIKQQFKLALKDLGIAGAAMIPEGYKIEEFGRNATQFPFLELIEHHDKAMSKSVLASFLDEEAPKLIDGNSDSLSDFFIMALEATIGEIESNVNNHLIPQLIDWNFGSGLYPSWEMAKLGDEAKAAIRKTFDALAVAATTNTTPEFMFEIEQAIAEELGLDIDYEAIEERQRKEAELEAEVTEATSEATIKVAKLPPQAPAPPKPKAIAASQVLSLADLMALSSEFDE